MDERRHKQNLRNSCKPTADLSIRNCTKFSKILQDSDKATLWAFVRLLTAVDQLLSLNCQCGFVPEGEALKQFPIQILQLSLSVSFLHSSILIFHQYDTEDVRPNLSNLQHWRGNNYRQSQSTFYKNCTLSQAAIFGFYKRTT